MPEVRILLAAGDAEFAGYVTALLGQMGYSVLPRVSSVEEAGQKAASQRPDLILLDLDLCKGSGSIEEAARIQPELEIPVVYLVGQDQAELCRRALRTSPFGCLLRPVSRLGLESAIEMSLRRHALHLQLEERESELRTLVENVPGVVYRCQIDPPWRMEQMSDGVLALTGRHKSEFLSGAVDWAGITHPGDLEYVAREVAAAVEQQRPYHIMYRIHDSNGSIRWVEECGRCIVGRDGRQRHLDGVLLDVTERNLAEQERANAHAELQAIYASVPVALMLVDKDRRVQKANMAASAAAGRAVTGMSGVTAGEALRCLNSLEDERGCGFGPSCESCSIRQAVKQTFEDGVQRAGIEAWMRVAGPGPDKEICLLLTTTLLDYDGERKVLVSAQDITEKKKSEAELEAERAELKAVYEHAPTMMCVLDPNGKVLYRNQAFAAFAGPAGVSPQGAGAAGAGCERILRNLGLCAYDSEGPQCTLCDAVESTLKTGIENVDVEFRTAVGEGAARHDAILLCSTAMIPAGANSRLLICLTDITERRLAEEALIESERRFSQVSELTREMIWEIDPSGLYTYVSSACFEMLGYRPDEIAGKIHYYDLHPPEGREEFKAVTMRTISNREPFVSYSNPVQTKNGRVLHISTNAAPVLAGDGSLVCYRGADRDVTEEKENEARLAQAQKMESVGRLAGGVAHDFNNLLTVINGYCQLALDKLDQKDPSRKHVQEILKAGERAAGLTKQLLAFSRKQVLDPKVTSINEVIVGLRPLLDRLMGDNARITMSLDPSTRPVFADKHQMEQVLMNLAVNARDAMPEGGTLRLRTFSTRPDEVKLRHLKAPAGQYTVMSVSDDGAGMEETVRQRVFEPFFTTKETGRGTGLGLSIVHGIIEQSNGFIEVESEPGRGSTFSVYLPVTDLDQPRG